MGTKRPKSYTELHENMKKVVHALMEGEKTYSELRKTRDEDNKDDKDIPEKTLSRILKILEFCGLIKRTARGWAWYTYKKKYHPRLAEHAKHLAPGLAALSPSYVSTRYTPNNQDPNVLALDSTSRDIKRLNQFKEYALQHIISGYPTIDNLLTQFRNLKSKLDKMQTDETVKFVNKLEEEGKTKKLFPMLMQVSESLAGELSKLLLKIEFGHHLDGECELCREIVFVDTETNHL